MFVWDGDNLTLTVEIWRIREFFFKIINRIYLLLGKGWYFIDCGYCDRENGKMVCRSPARLSDDKGCYPEECNSEFDCAYVDRRNGEMICRCPTRISDDPKCTEECRKRAKEASLCLDQTD